MYKSVLLLDLDMIHANEVAASLYSRGMRVMRCDSVVGLNAALKGSWDLVLTEWDFYHLSGAGLIGLLQPRRQPVLVYSRRETGAIAAEALEAGAKGVFSKYSRAELIEEIDRQMSGDAEPFEDERSILVVDDSVTMRRFLRAAFERGIPGARLLEAEDGKTALRVLTGSRVDLIVTDLQMPGMDGQSFVQMLRRNGLLKKKPVLIVTGEADAGLEKRISEDAFSALIRKPPPPDELVAMARQLMSPQAALPS